MIFSDKLKECYFNIKSVYDLAAFCYTYLIDAVRNQNVFLGEYTIPNKGVEKNPNLLLLYQFSMKIKRMVEKYPVGLFSACGKADELFEITQSIEKDLKEFGDAFLNNATIPFFLLTGLDLYFQDRRYESFEPAPLNEYCKDICMVYINMGSPLMDGIIDAKQYPSTIEKNGIREGFKHIIFLETNELPKGYGVPRLVTLQKKEEELNSIIKKKQIKMAAIPTLKEKWFDFELVRGASFIINYQSCLLEQVKNRVVSLLEYAIDCGVNIIIFPEYVCNDDIQIAIHETLQRMSFKEPEKLKELLFVVAGSCWTEDSNNVCFLYSYDGFEIGRVYKYSAYSNKKNGITYKERLMDPGKEITLVKVPEIGIFQTEICRNVSENGFCWWLARVFGTQFLLIPAWSASVYHGFKKQIDAIVSSNHKTCSLISNCCAAFSDCTRFRRQIGGASVPQKNETIVESRFIPLQRNEEECKSFCEAGCIFEICFDFNGNGENDVEVHNICKYCLKKKGECI